MFASSSRAKKLEFFFLHPNVKKNEIFDPPYIPKWLNLLLLSHAAICQKSISLPLFQLAVMRKKIKKIWKWVILVYKSEKGYINLKGVKNFIFLALGTEEKKFKKLWVWAFLFWSWFELRTLHILCIVSTNWIKFTMTSSSFAIGFISKKMDSMINIFVLWMFFELEDFLYRGLNTIKL